MANIRYCDPDSEIGGDGTTNALTGANCAYKSLSIWEAARQAVLTDIEECICESNGGSHTADTTVVVINGWTTTVDYYINIHTTTAARHDGKWNTGKYRLITTTGTAITNYEDYVRIEGLQLNSGDSHGFYNDDIGTGGEIMISNNIVKGNTATTVRGIFLYAERTFKVWNNIVYDYTDANGVGIYVIKLAANASVYNNTVYNCGVGLYRHSGTFVAKNNISYNNTDNYYGTFDASSTNNLSGPTQTDAPGLNSRNGVTVTFVNPTGSPPDFHLASSDAGARNYGTDLSADANLPFSTDIDGQTRPGENVWDIGADEYVAVVTGGNLFFLHG